MASRTLVLGAIAALIGAGVAYVYFRRRNTEQYSAPKAKPPVQGAIPILSTTAYTIHGVNDKGVQRNAYYVYTEWNPVFLPPGAYSRMEGNFYTTRYGAIGDDHERYNDGNIRRKYAPTMMLALIGDVKGWPAQLGPLPKKWSDAGGMGMPGRYVAYTDMHDAADVVRSKIDEGYKITSIERYGVWYNPANKSLVNDDGDEFALVGTLAEPIASNIEANTTGAPTKEPDVADVDIPAGEITEGWLAPIDNIWSKILNNKDMAIISNMSDAPKSVVKRLPEAQHTIYGDDLKSRTGIVFAKDWVYVVIYDSSLKILGVLKCSKYLWSNMNGDYSVDDWIQIKDNLKELQEQSQRTLSGMIEGTVASSSIPEGDITEGWAAQESSEPASVTEFKEQFGFDYRTVPHSQLSDYHKTGVVEFKIMAGEPLTPEEEITNKKLLAIGSMSQKEMRNVIFRAPSPVPDTQSFISIRGVKVPRYRCSKCNLPMVQADGFLTCDIHGGVEPVDVDKMSDTDKFEALDDEIYRLIIKSDKSVITAKDIGVDSAYWSLWIYAPSDPDTRRHKEYFIENYNKILSEE